MKRMMMTAVALSLLGGATAMAQPADQTGHYRPGKDGGHQGAAAHPMHGNRMGHGPMRHGPMRHGPMRRGGGGPMPGMRQVADLPHWSRGDRLPRGYIGQQAPWVDWRARHFRRPPPGYQWVAYDNRFLLVAAASGFIADVIMTNGMP